MRNVYNRLGPVFTLFRSRRFVVNMLDSGKETRHKWNFKKEPVGAVKLVSDFERNNPWLVGDIGGTHARFGLVCGETRGLEFVEVFTCADFSGLDQVVTHYLQKRGVVSLERACLAVAGPVTGDWIRLTNSRWGFSPRRLKAALKIGFLAVINDFQALSLALPHLAGSHSTPLGPTMAVSNEGPRVVIGPGTGLGVAALVRDPGGRWLAVPGEGGHVSFAPQNPLEDRILVCLRQRYGRVSVERILCGAGLSLLYEILGLLEQVPKECLTDREITGRALGGEKNASLCLDVFCGVLGSVAGDVALTFHATGGVFIGGGMVPRFLDFIKNSCFRTRFEEKGRFKTLLEPIPTRVITAANPALRGAAAYLADVRSGA